jgi:bile acid-coenzyme A ligase
MSSTPTGAEYTFTVGTVPMVRVLCERAAAHPDRPCFTVDETTLTYRDLDEQSNALARVLADLGVKLGDRVTLVLPNTPQHVVSLWATLKLGATPNPISPRLTAPELRAIIGLARPRLVIGGDPAHMGALPHLPEGFEIPAGTSVAALAEEHVSPVMKAPTSGGSTGRPKLILFGTPAVIDVSTPPFGFPVNSVMMIPGPLHHNAPLTNFLYGVAFGNHMVGMSRFDADKALAAIQMHRVRRVFFVPTMLHRIWRLPPEIRASYDLTSLSEVTTSGAALAPWLKQAWIDWIGSDRLVEVYGTTEGVAITKITGQDALDHPMSVGKVVFGEMRIFDEQGNALSPGEIGEIYMRNDLSRQTFSYVGSEARQHGEWIGFGDLGHFDEEGYLYLADRMLDKIISGGVNIFPAEVEAAISEHPDVLSCVVVGLPDDDLGQRVHAIVQSRAPLTQEDLGSFLAGRLVRYKVPRSFEFTDSPLRDDAGKVRRSALSQERAKGKGGAK